MNEVWILGATGRIGALVAERLRNANTELVLVGRYQDRLRALAAILADGTGRQPRVLAEGSLKGIAGRLATSRAAVVVNTIGPFSETASTIIEALPPRAAYLDLSNELDATITFLDRDKNAVAAGHTLVAGAGFGVLAAESILLKLCEDRPPALQVRVDMIPSADIAAGPIGRAFAATVVDVIATGGRRYENGNLRRAGLGHDAATLTLPGGEVVQTGGGPSGELVVAQRISGAPSVVVASAAAPAGPLRIAAPLISALIGLPPVRRFATRRIAAVVGKAQTRKREFSFAHARVEWSTGAIREGWLRTGDAMVFTADVAAEVARRLVLGEGRPGAYTPGAIFGPDLAIAAGGTFILPSG